MEILQLTLLLLVLLQVLLSFEAQWYLIIQSEFLVSLFLL